TLVRKRPYLDLPTESPGLCTSAARPVLNWLQSYRWLEPLYKRNQRWLTSNQVFRSPQTLGMNVGTQKTLSGPAHRVPRPLHLRSPSSFELATKQSMVGTSVQKESTMAH